MENDWRYTETGADAQSGGGTEAMHPTSEEFEIRLKNDSTNAKDNDADESNSSTEEGNAERDSWMDFWYSTEGSGGKCDDPAWNTYNPENWKIVPEEVVASGGKPLPDRPVFGFCIKLPPPPAMLFTVFPNLPIEMRRKIWKHALPDPRVVQLDIVGCRSRLVHGGQSPAEPHFACIESREIFEQNYHQLLLHGTQLVLPNGVLQTPMRLGYIDSRRDTVLIDLKSLQARGEYGPWLDLSEVQHLAVARHDQMQQVQSVWQYTDAMCPRLRSLTVVLGTITPDGPNYDYEGERLHLTEVNTDLRLLEISDKWSGQSPRTRSGQYWAFAREDDIVPFLTTATTLNTQFEELLREDNKTWKDVNFTVAMLSTEDSEGHWIHEIIHLAPVVPQPYHASYYALRYFRSNKSYLWVKELDLCMSCERSGALNCPYDGIKELFGHDGGF